MPRAMVLDVWLYGHRVARLSEPSTYRYRLDFTEEAFDVFGPGARVLSLGLPFERRAVTDTREPGKRRVSAFLEGLLPEGNLRQHMASTLGVPTIDKMALLGAVGAECAGAVQFLPEGVTPSRGSVRALTSDELARLVADLPTYHLPPGASPQASLAGIQDKVLLTALPDGSWGWPEKGAVSTHLIKPEPAGGAALAQLIQTENWAMAVAQAAGLPASRTRLDEFGGRAALVVTRYDRTDDGERTHQEDACQALGLDPAAKYENTLEYEKFGSRLKRLVAVAADRAQDPQEFRTALLSAISFNVVLGNGDAHSKNYSLLIGRRGEVSLAQLYDVAPVMFLDRNYSRTGHVINGRTNIDWVGEEDLIAEARSWGLAERRASATVRSVMERVRQAVHDVPLPPGAEGVLERLDSLWDRRGWLR